MTATPASGRGVTWRPLGSREVLVDLPADSPAAPLQVMEYDPATSERVLHRIFGGGAIKGANRCSATGLYSNDCHFHRVDGRYCYYHQKMQQGLIDYCMDERTITHIIELSVEHLRRGMVLGADVRSSGGVVIARRDEKVTQRLLDELADDPRSAGFVSVKFTEKHWVEIPPEARYQVWPLPREGYALLDEEAAA